MGRQNAPSHAVCLKAQFISDFGARVPRTSRPAKVLQHLPFEVQKPARPRAGCNCPSPPGRAGLLTPIKQDIWNTLPRGRMSRLQGVCTPLLAPHQSKLHILVVIISIATLLATLVTKSHDPLSSSLFSGSLKIKVLYTVSERLAPCLLALRFRCSICQLPDAGHLEL